MMTKGLKINGDDSDILSVRLEHLLNCYDRSEGDVSWGLLWLDVVMRPEVGYNILELEGEINNSDFGKKISLEKLLEFSSQISQAINILVLGDKDPKNIKRFETDDLMYAKCEYVIELVDSSYWIVHSNNSVFLNNIFEKIPGTEYLNSIL
ncbi:hypothetical protein [Sphingobacterium haloxyli]|uniref:Uncharacterized protein n=1 Tax=Sphingobacterium haloxyli TaxID=2100533 RepID=A0A2S9ITA9_9SPHI|nr:hypothetical protein [Sphingobacterium haloxyli]PRD43774.1 hypothetical protein C5745_19805 [Sphingobacterium haloxyli]